jgi:hypothetical protein
MGQHGASSGTQVRHKLGRSSAARTAAVAPGPAQGYAQGFRHFIREPGPGERFAFGGVPYDSTNESMRVAAQQLMRRLARRLEREPPPAGGNFDNPNIPSGYTYLFQLAAHDLVHSTVLLSLAEGRLTAIANSRAVPLRLETIFGEGPAARPDLYDKSTSGSRFHPRLRVGPLRENGTLGAGGETPVITNLEFDIARGGCPFGHDQRAKGLPEPMIGDPRNDDHPILSQLVVLFHHLHNTILGEIAAAPGHPAMGSPFDTDHVNYLCARTATTLIYRTLIRRDLLARLLHPAVHDAYERGLVPVADQPVVPGTRWKAPFELTHGALRAAHTMVRPSYVFNGEGHPEEFTLRNMLLQSSDDLPAQMPLQTKWALDWTRFFGNGPPMAFNYSRRIRPHYDGHLLDDLTFPSENGDGVAGLAYRDLLSGMDGMPWSVAALVAALRATHGTLLARSPLLTPNPAQPSAKPWAAPLAAWLKAVPAYQDADTFSDAEADALSNDPPLSLFIAFEAMTDPATGGGERLGVLGSILIADVIYNVLRRDPIIQDEVMLGPSAQMAALSALIFGAAPNLLAFVPDITTFDQLLAFMKPRMPQVF